MNIYNYFKSKLGSEHIAKPPTIEAIINICAEESPKTVLELGAGIGTLTYTILFNSTAHIDTYEGTPFCIDQLKKNLKGLEYNLITDYRQLPPHKDYDLIIVDGGAGSDLDTGYMRAIFLFLQSLDSVKIIYVEGRRMGQRAFIRRGLVDRYTYKTEIVEGDNDKGGIIFRCKRTKSKLKRYGLYIYWKLRCKIKEV